MRIRLCILGTAIWAVLLISVIAVQASARRIEVSNQTNRMVWTTFEITAEGSTIRCPLTLEGSFHSRTYSKVSGQLVGYITRAQTRSESCAGAIEFSLGTEKLPWHVGYNSFVGSLPSFTAVQIQIIDLHFSVWPNLFSFHCGFWFRRIRPALLRLERTAETVRTARFDETISVEASEGGCVERARVSGTGEVFVLGSTTTRISVRLVQ
jgi:hypothetical protein